MVSMYSMNLMAIGRGGEYHPGPLYRGISVLFGVPFVLVSLCCGLWPGVGLLDHVVVRFGVCVCGVS